MEQQLEMKQEMYRVWGMARFLLERMHCEGSLSGFWVGQVKCVVEVVNVLFETSLH